MNRNGQVDGDDEFNSHIENMINIGIILLGS